ncbi:hypothetical protein MNBD_ALPHA01-1652 [hydrothermal vent metagenome]|uniref:Uncharacterized protein n=1 Tax=hydrothermal vent metagenome TaxID=652676 RepID=A0A3B0SK05_9ZZZZ
MRLLNGLTFGVGAGLVTTGLSDMADGYNISLLAIGSLLMTTELIRIFFRPENQP